MILFTGGCLPHCMLGYHHTPPRSRHPPEQTPPQSRHPLEQTLPKQTPPQSRHTHPQGADTPLQSRHPLAADTQTSPWEQTPPPEQTSPWEQTPPGANTPWSRHPPGADTPQSRHTPQEQTPPGADIHLRCRACWEVRSTRGTGMLFLSKFILRVQKSITHTTYLLLIVVT